MRYIEILKGGVVTALKVHGTLSRWELLPHSGQNWSVLRNSLHRIA